MEDGHSYFSKPLKYVVELTGDCDGEQFTIRGEGTGDANTGEKGRVQIKFVCTSGECPVAWESLASLMCYGAKCFIKYPSGIKDFYKTCFPKGYIQDRTIQFENDGKFIAHSELTLKDGTIYHKCTLNAEGLKKDGHIRMRNIASIPQFCASIFPDGDGVRMCNRIVFPLKTGGYITSLADQVNRPLFGAKPEIPKNHFCYSDIRLTQDASETKDHIIVDETVIAKDPYHV